MSLQNLLLHSLLILIYSLILKTVYANFVKLGVLDFEKIPPLAGIITFGDVQTRNVIKKFLFEKDRGSRITI